MKLSDFTNTLNGLGQTAADIIAATNGSPKVVTPQSADSAKAEKADEKAKWLPFAIGAAVVALVIYLVSRK